ncbi:MAG: DUF2330 domain-containing protein [Actinomycetota bacterium]|nr:DUF2330 domain-containing protein [Actinomycetota bacterium]
MRPSLSAAVLVVVLSASRALACGGMVSPNGSAELLGFEALLRWDDGHTQELTVSVAYTTGRPFGWLMPFPEPPEVTEGDPAMFQTAAELTEPPEKADIVPELIPSEEGEGVVTGGAPGSVEIFGRSTIGGLRFVTLGGEGAKDVARWMTHHGFRFHDRQEPVLQRYLDRDWVVVAARVAPGDAFTGTILPVTFRFETSDPVYPLAMAGTGHEEQDLDLKLFLLTPARPTSTTYPERVVHAGPDGYPLRVGRQLELRYSAPLGADAGRLQATPSTWLSRYEGDLRSETLTEDLVFGEAADQTPIDFGQLLADLRTQRTWIYVQRVAYPILLLLTILLIAGTFIRRGRQLNVAA